MSAGIDIPTVEVRLAFEWRRCKCFRKKFMRDLSSRKWAVFSGWKAPSSPIMPRSRVGHTNWHTAATPIPSQIGTVCSTVRSGTLRSTPGSCGEASSWDAATEKWFSVLTLFPTMPRSRSVEASETVRSRTSTDHPEVVCCSSGWPCPATTWKATSWERNISRRHCSIATMRFTASLQGMKLLKSCSSESFRLLFTEAVPLVSQTRMTSMETRPSSRRTRASASASNWGFCSLFTACTTTRTSPCWQTGTQMLLLAILSGPASTRSQKRGSARASLTLTAFCVANAAATRPWPLSAAAERPLGSCCVKVCDSCDSASR
mmetsp:Transcript_52302/g.147230  ORF Transcript_52302/g.147230 Transcript_52302/m.147230 type:complete len:318 (+) Transcript_52302:179-1132(+)